MLNTLHCKSGKISFAFSFLSCGAEYIYQQIFESPVSCNQYNLKIQHGKNINFTNKVRFDLEDL